MDPKKMWLIKGDDQNITGPINTLEVNEMIQDNLLDGTELICNYPNGEWKRISRIDYFYNQLIESLDVKSKKKNSAFADEPTIISALPPGVKGSVPRKLNEKPVEAGPISNQELPIISEMKPSTEVPMEKSEATVIQNKNNEIDLIKQDLSTQNESEFSNEAEAEEQIKQKVKFSKEYWLSKKKELSLAILAIGIILYLIFFENPTSSEGKYNLIQPNFKSGRKLSAAESKELYKSIIRHVQLDTLSNYKNAQSKLVALIEADAMNLEYRGLLCLIYRELWPYAKQDAMDTKVLNDFVQGTKVLNLTSPFGSFCEVSKMIITGQYKEAKGSIDGILDSSEYFSLIPILYEFKGELLENESDYLNAIPYLEKSTTTFDWLKAHFNLASTLYKKGENLKALEVLRGIISKNQKHKSAKVLAGIIYYNSFKQAKEAYEILQSAYAIDEIIPKRLEAQGYLVLAKISEEYNDKSLARNYAEKALKANPSNNEIKDFVVRIGGNDKISEKDSNSELMYLGDQFVRNGNCLAAQAEYKAAFNANPKIGIAAVKAAKCLWMLNQTYEAIEWLNKAIKAEPKLISAYVLESDYLAQRYDFEKALQILSDAQRVSPNNHEVMRGIASLELRKNNILSAISYGERARTIYDGDIETYILLAKANLQFALSLNATNKKDSEKKVKAAQDSMRYAARAIEIDSTSVEGQITYAKMLAAHNGIDSGIQYINELIKKFSFSLEYKLALADLLKSEERFSQAKEVYEQVVAIEPRSKAGLIGLSECLRMIGQNDKAIKNYLSAAIIDPSDAEPIFQVGKIYLEISKYTEAIDQFKRVQRINPLYPRANYYLGKTALLAGDLETASKFVMAEKKSNPNIADSYILAAEIYASKKMFSECASEYSIAMKLRPQGSEIYIKSAQCYRKAGSLDIADDMLGLALKIESGNADIYKEQGAIYETKGDFRSAAAAYNKYLGLSPNASDKYEIESRIRKMGGL